MEHSIQLPWREVGRHWTENLQDLFYILERVMRHVLMGNRWVGRGVLRYPYSFLAFLFYRTHIKPASSPPSGPVLPNGPSPCYRVFCSLQLFLKKETCWCMVFLISPLVVDLFSSKVHALIHLHFVTP